MAEALWVQAAGVDYSAAEDRRLISSIFNPGIVTGLGISAGAGLSVLVGAGRAIVPDGQGGAYLCYFDAATTRGGLAANGSNSLYCVVNTTTGQATIETGATPTFPFVRLGGAVTGAAAVTSTSRGATASLVLEALTPASLTIAGILVATATGLTAPKGIRLGGAANAQMRYAARAARALTRQLIPTATFTTVLFDRLDHEANDYGGTSVNLSGANQGLFVAPVAGTYQVSGEAHFVNQVGASNTRRQMRIVGRTSAGVARWIKYGSMRPAGDNWDHVWADGTLDMLAGQTVEFQVYHDEDHSVYLSDNAATPTPGSMGGGDLSYGMMTLLATD